MFPTDNPAGGSNIVPGLGFDMAPSKPKIEGYSDSMIKIDFEMDPAQGEERHITAYFTNLCGSDLSNISMLVAGQKHLKIALQPLTGTVLYGNQSNSLQLEMRVTNPFEGTKPIALKLKIMYTCNGKPINAMKVVTFPLN